MLACSLGNSLHDEIHHRAFCWISTNATICGLRNKTFCREIPPFRLRRQKNPFWNISIIPPFIRSICARGRKRRRIEVEGFQTMFSLPPFLYLRRSRQVLERLELLLLLLLGWLLLQHFGFIYSLWGRIRLLKEFFCLTSVNEFSFGLESLLLIQLLLNL